MASNVYKCVAKEIWVLASLYEFGFYYAITEKRRPSGLFLFLFLIFFNTNIALCFYHSIIAMKVIINSISGCRKFGGKAINFTVQRFCKESCVKHSETGD